jgi:hypothetical protein
VSARVFSLASMSARAPEPSSFQTVSTSPGPSAASAAARPGRAESAPETPRFSKTRSHLAASSAAVQNVLQQAETLSTVFSEG